MAGAVTHASDATADLAIMAGAAVLGSLVLPGLPRQVRQARTFLTEALGELGSITDTVVLLATELVTNAIAHTRSGDPGGTVALVVLETAGGVQVEVTDNGSDVC